MSVLKYRPDIDGLRAIAVLSVVVYHFNPKWIPKGFFGVDIFLVISGYLITSIIYREMLEGRFSFKEFYIRRIKRILPLFFVVLITGLLVSWCVFLSKDIIGVAHMALSSVGFLANFYSARRGGDMPFYEKPFLHLWSLSVEEQFYFLFPIVLILIMKTPFLKQNILTTLGFSVILLLLLGFFDLRKVGIYWDPYYLSHTRFGEILLGSFLAVYREEREGEVKVNNYWSLILLLILIGCLFFGKSFLFQYYPGISALLPCGATALLIYLNERGNWVSQCLSLKPIVWLGKISYSLYLWHWVILAIIRYIYKKDELSLDLSLIAIVLMIFLSVLTYYFVETPARKLKMSFWKSLVYFYILPSILVGGIVWGMKKGVYDKQDDVSWTKGKMYNENQR